MHDQLATGRKLRVLTIVDTFSRFSPAREPRFSFRGPDVVEVLEKVGREVGLPATMGSTKAPSLYRAILIYGLINAASRSTSPGQESRPTMRSSKRSTVASAPSV